MGNSRRRQLAWLFGGAFVSGCAGIVLVSAVAFLNLSSARVETARLFQKVPSLNRSEPEALRVYLNKTHLATARRLGVHTLRRDDIAPLVATGELAPSRGLEALLPGRLFATPMRSSFRECSRPWKRSGSGTTTS